jgi:DNA gyrase subunit A
VKAISLEGDATAVGMLLVRRDADVLMVHENGTGKRTAISEFPLQKRGGKGTQLVPSKGAGSRSRSPLVGALEVGGDDTVMVVLAGGQVHRVDVDSVPVQGRRTAGRQIVLVPRGGRVVELARSAEGGSSRRGASDDATSAVAAATSEDAETGASEPRADDEGQFALLDE